MKIKCDYGETYPDLIISYCNMGCIKYILEEYEGAIEHCNSAIKLIENLFNGENLYLITAYSILGRIYYTTKKYKEAADLLLKCENIMVKFYGDNCSDLSILYNNLGLTYEKLHEYNKAIQYYDNGLGIFIKFFKNEKNKSYHVTRTEFKLKQLYNKLHNE